MSRRASGGVGTLAIQFAKLCGARVLATASGIDGLEFMRDMGADAAVDARHEDSSEAARHFAPAGVDAILALAGGELEGLLATLRAGGRIAYPHSIEPAPKKRRGIKFIPYDGIAGVREFRRLNGAVKAAKLKVPIAQVFPLFNADGAHERVAKGHVLGKIVLRIHEL